MTRYAVILAGVCWTIAPTAGAAAELSRSASGLAYEVTGSGPTVVLIHGSNLDHRLWDGEAELLRASYRVLRYDLRGHGQSEIPTEPFLAVEDLAGLLDELDVKEATLVGLSAGAAVALDCALEHPQRVRGLFLASPTVGGYRPQEKPPFFGELAEALKAGDPARANQVLLDSPVMRVSDEHRDLVTAMVRGNERLWTIPPTLVRQLDPPAVERLRELTMPVAVAVGEADMADVRRQAELIVEKVGNGSLHVVPGGGHLLNLTSSQAFRSLLTDFLGNPEPK